jgi:hypothetical protein
MTTDGERPRAGDDGAHRDAMDARPGAVIGWIHHPLPHGIALEVQTAASAAALDGGRVDTARLVLTRNQALLLASFLLRVTGHSAADVPDARRRGWRRWLGRR